MKKNTPSLTAELAAMMRSVASRSCTLRKTFDDRYARLFCGIRSKPAFFLNLFLSLFDPSLTRIKIPMLQVGLLCALIRHRFMENFVISMLQKDKSQLVLLGAGYDTKSLRLKNDCVRIFEIDHPLTQRRKLSILKKNKLITSDTCYISCNLTNENPGEYLKVNGIDRNVPIVVVAEGVLSYFQKSRISELIEDIGSLGNDVSLIFDYRQPLSGELHSAKSWYKQFKNKGEQYLGLFTKDEMDQLLDKKGFTTDSASDLFDIAKQFLPTFSAIDLKGSSEIRTVSKKSSVRLIHE